MTEDIFHNPIKQVDSLSNVREDRVVGKPKSLKAMIGTGKGCFKTPQEADDFIRRERDKWPFKMQFAASR
ncbi:MAG: hypothetical protein AB4352_29265 [Hormoscilla sp.]